MITPYWTSKDGRFVIYCGDCLEILPTLGKVDAVVTDPPYGISHKPLPGQGKTAKRMGSVNNWHPQSTWDKTFKTQWGEAISNSTNIIAWFGHWRKREYIEKIISYPLRCEIVWYKNCHVGPPAPVAPIDERIWIFSNSKITPTRFETSVWYEPIIPTWNFKNHLNEKPLCLMIRIVSWIDANTILDPFMGSGTTGVACARLGRKFIGIEISKEYCDIAIERIKGELSQPRLELEPQPAFKQVDLF